MLSSLRHSLWVLSGGVCALGEVQGLCRKVQILYRLCSGVCGGSLKGALCHSAASWTVLQVLEEKPSGLLVASLQAKDPDEGENGTIIYSLIGMSCRTD